MKSSCDACRSRPGELLQHLPGQHTQPRATQGKGKSRDSDLHWPSLRGNRAATAIRYWRVGSFNVQGAAGQYTKPHRSKFPKQVSKGKSRSTLVKTWVIQTAGPEDRTYISGCRGGEYAGCQPPKGLSGNSHLEVFQGFFLFTPKHNPNNTWHLTACSLTAPVATFHLSVHSIQTALCNSYRHPLCF